MKLFQFLNQNYSQEDFIQAFHDIDNKIYNDLTCKDYKRYAILHKNKKYPVKLTLECMCRNKGIFIDRKDFGSNKQLRNKIERFGFKIVSDKQNYYWVCQGKNFEEEYQEGIIKSAAKKLYNTMQNIKEGDIIINYYQSKIIAYSEVTTDCKIIDDNYVVKLNYNKLKSPIGLDVIREKLGSIKNIKKILKRSNKLPFKECNDKKNGNRIDAMTNGYCFLINKEMFDLLLEDCIKDRETKPMKNIQLNQILYGPPGTGKTYNTINYAVAVIEEKKIEDIQTENYEEVQKRFKTYKQSGLIEFVTFHQSYSYEEFVEGIKPVISKWNNKTGDEIKYCGKDGIFKEICENPDVDTCCNKLANYLDNNNNEVYLYTIDKKAKFLLKNAQNSKSFEIIPQTDKKTSNYIKYEEIANIEEMNGREGYAKAILQFIKEIFINGPRVLIIDEINRGNISKIFGELITLIEADKRIGNDNELKVKLPYSKQEFGVPNNLYIIGTMNTSDRSIASVDIALRRRFKFIEMMPNTTLFKDVKINEFDGKTLKDFLELLNKRISILLDRDHQIGHSYFIEIKDKKQISINDIRDIWFDSIMPLLNEYFYGDWEKLQAILGEANNNENKSFIIQYNKNEERLNTYFAYDYKECDFENYYDFAKNTDTFDFKNAMRNAFGILYKKEQSADKYTLDEIQKESN